MKNRPIFLVFCVWDPWLWHYKYIVAAPEHLHLQNKYKLRRFRATVIECYYWNDIPTSVREKPTRKHFLKSSFYVLLFLVFINVFLSLCTIDIFVVKSVIPIPSHISIAFVLLYEKNAIWRKGHLISLLYYA